MVRTLRLMAGCALLIALLAATPALARAADNPEIPVGAEIADLPWGFSGAAYYVTLVRGERSGVPDLPPWVQPIGEPGGDIITPSNSTLSLPNPSATTGATGGLSQTSLGVSSGAPMMGSAATGAPSELNEARRLRQDLRSLSRKLLD